MEDSDQRIVADTWSWRTLVPWIVPPLVIPIVLIILVTGYVIYQGVN